VNVPTPVGGVGVTAGSSGLGVSVGGVSVGVGTGGSNSPLTVNLGGLL
jgi:hypothetical protein